MIHRPAAVSFIAKQSQIFVIILRFLVEHLECHIRLTLAPGTKNLPASSLTQYFH
jgi:hypothetical protein